ncbi:hypothetical protein SeseC_02173 [Streptococcus equi subsp. zooepidemicus ATCC 35246]|nr:hypothetical protein SeseC_02173 [Streptococcus equi subsp. zooepidemicus ATCC 35246]
MPFRSLTCDWGISFDFRAYFCYNKMNKENEVETLCQNY